MLRRTRVWLGLFAAFFSTSTLAGTGDFPRTPALTGPIEFWTSVFTKYTKYDVILHDDLYLDKIVEVIDYSGLAPRGMNEDRLRVWINRESDNALAHARRSFEEAQAAGDDPSRLSGQARRVWDLYKDFKEPNKYLAARDRLRLQHGIRERYAHALWESSHYLPQMESTFRSRGLPIELTRLPFIESSFNVKAYSVAKAAGIWQFIPSAARIYMRLNNTVDDRRDPWFSTEAAARHLRDDYDALGSWPLAITSYNQGRYAMVKAVAELGTRDIGEIIRNYHGPRFKFAGRNFYVEFCAAMDIAADPEKYFGRSVARAPEIKFDEVTTRQRLSYDTLRRMSGASKEEFLTLNPSYRPEVVKGKMLVPAGHRIRIPYGQAVAFNAAYASKAALLAAADAEEEKAQQAQPVAVTSKRIRYHRIKRGDTLASVARRYRVELADLRKANRLNGRHTLRIGQRLKVPGAVAVEQQIVADLDQPGDKKTAARVVADAGQDTATKDPATKKAPAARAAANSSSNVDFEQAALVVERRIAAGQTLGQLAKKYGSSARAIQEANGIKNLRTIRAGRLLKIPVGESYAASDTAKKSVAGTKSPAKLAAPSSITATVANEAKQAKRGSVPVAAKPAPAAAASHKGLLGETLASTKPPKRVSAPPAAKPATAASHKGLLGEMLASAESSPRGTLSADAVSGSAAIAAEKAVGKKSASATQHSVSAGETIWNIAKQYRTSVAAIKTANGLHSIKRIKIGQTLVIPGSADEHSPL